MRIYLDNCCFNRPFDDQSQLRVRLESEAKLKVQEDILAGRYELVWSYILEFENSRNPFPERRDHIARWKSNSRVVMEEDSVILRSAEAIARNGVKVLDSLHVACALRAEAECFLTTDDKILKKTAGIQDIRILDPVAFIREVTL